MSVMSIMPNLDLEGDSINFKNWESLYLDIKTCEACRKSMAKYTASIQGDINPSTIDAAAGFCPCVR